MNRRRCIREALVPLVAALVLAACSERSASPTTPADDATEVAINNFAFAAPTITIDRGTVVRWRNTTATFHTITPDGHQAFAARQTNTQGQTIEVRFDEAGRFRYYCDPHRALGMTGEVIVR